MLRFGFIVKEFTSKGIALEFNEQFIFYAKFY